MSTPRLSKDGTHGEDERRPHVIKCSTFGTGEREKQNLRCEGKGINRNFVLPVKRNRVCDRV
jgi:hypothetical protein